MVKQSEDGAEVEISRRSKRKRERRWCDKEYQRRVESLRREIAAARKKRKWMMLLLLIALLAILQSGLTRSLGMNLYRQILESGSGTWQPSPEADYAPQPGLDDFCDGYSFQQWRAMCDARGVRLCRKTENLISWKNAADYAQFPLRYQEWHHRPFLGQVMTELSTPYWKDDAFKALRLLAPPDVHEYLDEAYVTDPTDLRQCHAERDADIVRALRTRALLWAERKRREAEEIRRDQNERKPDDDGNGFRP